MLSYVLITFYWNLVNHAWAYVTMFRTSSVELLMLCFRSVCQLCVGPDVGLMYWLYWTCTIEPSCVEHVLCNQAVLNICQMLASCIGFDLLKCAIEPAKYSVQTTSSVQCVKTPLKPYIGVFKKIWNYAYQLLIYRHALWQNLRFKLVLQKIIWK